MQIPQQQRQQVTLSQKEIDNAMTTLNRNQMEHAEKSQMFDMIQDVIKKLAMVNRALTDEITGLKSTIEKYERKFGSLDKNETGSGEQDKGNKKKEKEKLPPEGK